MKNGINLSYYWANDLMWVSTCSKTALDTVTKKVHNMYSLMTERELRFLEEFVKVNGEI